MSVYNFTIFKNKTTEITAWLNKELFGIRTGRATPLILDHVLVKAYDGRVPIKQLAAIKIEDAKILRLTPWDKNHTKEIETAIAAANLGVSVAADGGGLRIIFPSLTTESRNNLLKLLKNKLEEAKVSLRQERDKIWQDVQSLEKQGKLSEDEKFRSKNELQKIVDGATEELEKIFQKKETEIMN